jgi:hypothetical protein
LGNFANYKENMEVNHELINGADFGKHKFLTLTNQATAPVTGATEAGIYGTQVAGRMVNFFQRESNLAEVGMTIYPGTTVAASFSGFTTVIDVATLVDATHPNFWGIFEIRTTDGIKVNGIAIIKVYKGTSGTQYSVFALNDSTGTGKPVYRFSGSLLQVRLNSPIVAAIANFTITPFYFPET